MPMAERVALGRAEGAGVGDCPARHCWVLDAADGSGLRRPGLLVEWRHTDDDDWLGRVVYAVQLRMGEWATLEEWVPAPLVESA